MAKTYQNARETNRETVEQVTGMAGTLPPQATDLEEAVLGALMLEKDAIVNVHDILSAEVFYSVPHQKIYTAIDELANEMNPIDVLTVTQKLRQKKQLTEVGGAAYLAKLTQRVASAAHLEFHSLIIAQKYVQRELIRASTEILKRSYDESTDVSELIEFAESEIFKITEGNIKNEVQPSSRILAATLAAIEEASKNDSALSGVPTGFQGIDRITLGWQKSDLIIIAARPSMGKTAFVLSMARNITVEHKRPVAFFSLEMSSTQLMMRLLIAESGLNGNDVKSGKLSPEDWGKLEQASRPLGEAPLFIDDTPAMSVSELRSKARRLKTQHDIQLIIIDYLQLMTVRSTENRNGNREQEVSLISRSLKAIAKELGIPIIALSQLSRAVESRGGSKRPALSDLRESGAIEQDADIVAFIHRPEYYGFTQDEDGVSTAGIAEIIIAKHRNGATDDVRLRFRKEQARFVDEDEFSGITAQAETYDTIDSEAFGLSQSDGMADPSYDPINSPAPF